MQSTLSLDTLGDLDGGAARAIIAAAIAEALRDLDDRGAARLAMSASGEVLHETPGSARTAKLRYDPESERLECRP